MLVKAAIVYRFLCMSFLPVLLMGFISGELTWKKR